MVFPICREERAVMDCVAADFIHLRQNYLINKLLANDFFSADSGHARWFGASCRMTRSSSTRSLPPKRQNHPEPLQQHRVRLNWTLALSTSRPCRVVATSRIPTHACPDSSSSTTSKPPPLREEHQPGQLKHPGACRLLYRMNLTYWLEVSVEVTSVVDEAVVCGRPIYQIKSF